MESRKYNKLVNITEKKQTHRYREQNSGYQWGEGGEGENRGGRGNRYKLLGIKIGHKDTMYITGNKNQYFIVTVNGVESLKVI